MCAAGEASGAESGVVMQMTRCQDGWYPDGVGVLRFAAVAPGIVHPPLLALLIDK